MCVAIARHEHLQQFARSVWEGEGCVAESDERLNDSNRALIAAYHGEHGQAWLGRVNRCGNETEDPPLYSWDGGAVCPFGASFVLPRFDAVLVRLLREWELSQYAGAHAHHLDAIMDRIDAVGGSQLTWS